MFLTEDKIKEIGFKSVGENVFISDKASFYNPGNILIGNNVRIDDFCILSAGEGGIIIGNYVHVSCFVCMIGKGKIEMKDYSCFSVKCTVFSSSDSFTAMCFTNPMIPDEQREVYSANVTLGENAVVGSGSVILPGVTIGDSASVGALSLIKSDIPGGELWAGVPAKFIKERK